jgi:hypothetical protein
MSTITLFTEMHTTNHVSEHVLQCASWYPVHSALNVGLKLLQCVCGWFECTVSLRCPHKRCLGGLSPGIVETTISLKWGVQKTQIPYKPWVAWLFEHPVFQLEFYFASHSWSCNSNLSQRTMVYYSNLHFLYSTHTPEHCVIQPKTYSHVLPNSLFILPFIVIGLTIIYDKI